ncbi:MAG: hypothetical protein AAF713_13100 [Pseudomonadota bacterium]
MRTQALLVASALLLGGCAIGNTYDYRAASVGLPATTPETLAIGVADQRDYVLSGKKTIDFIGLQRGGYGNPFDVTTASGKSLAEDFTALLAKSFGASGTRVETVVLAPGIAPDAAIERFQDTSAGRFLLIEMREWKTDAFAQVTVHWDLTARVFDANGNLLASETVQGVEGTEESGVFQDEKAKIAQREAKRRFEELLKTSEIASALR